MTGAFLVMTVGCAEGFVNSRGTLPSISTGWRGSSAQFTATDPASIRSEAFRLVLSTTVWILGLKTPSETMRRSGKLPAQDFVRPATFGLPGVRMGVDKARGEAHFGQIVPSRESELDCALVDHKLGGFRYADSKGERRHDHGVTPSRAICVEGLCLQRKGARDDQCVAECQWVDHDL
jgi:hypothetical protein